MSGNEVRLPIAMNPLKDVRLPGIGAGMLYINRFHALQWRLDLDHHGFFRSLPWHGKKMTGDWHKGGMEAGS